MRLEEYESFYNGSEKNAMILDNGIFHRLFIHSFANGVCFFGCTEPSPVPLLTRIADYKLSVCRRRIHY